jgi:hypothetical protein
MFVGRAGLLSYLYVFVLIWAVGEGGLLMVFFLGKLAREWRSVPAISIHFPLLVGI